MGRMKMSALDVKAVVSELRGLALGGRLQNLYDLDPRTFLLKFTVGDTKVYVFVETGVRMHLTELVRDKPKIPSQFTLKLRKHVRNWRLESVDQCGMDRTVDMRFGSGDACFHFVIELHSRGNFILTDSQYRIMMTLHVRIDDSTKTKIAVGETYPLNQFQFFSPISQDEVTSALSEAPEPQSLKQVVAAVGIYGPMISEHALLVVGLNPNDKKHSWGPRIGEIAPTITAALTACDKWFNEPLPCGGFAVAQCSRNSGPDNLGTVGSGDGPLPLAPGVAAAESGKMYIDFSPVMLRQFESQSSELIHRSSFSAVAEIYFAQFEARRIEQSKSKRTEVVQSKTERCQNFQKQRIEQLQADEEAHCLKAMLIEANADDVDAALDLVRMALGTGISWDSLRDVIRKRKREGHPIANMIHELHLERSSFSVLLPRDVLGEDVEECDVEPVVVDLEIGQSAHANACRYYAAKRANATKLAKTIAATDKAIEGAQRKGARTAAKAPPKKEIHVMRPTLWFEKFLWFLTSFGHLVVCPRDLKQADVLISRYMSPNDIYVHADAANATLAVVKNPTKSPMPTASLEEAGTMAICRSAAWDAKTAESAWWVYPSQLSKQTPQGDVLGPGVFHVNGRKNYFPVLPLALGIALLFRVSAAHLPPALHAAAGSLDPGVFPSERDANPAAGESDPPCAAEASELSSGAEEHQPHSSGNPKQGKTKGLDAFAAALEAAAEKHLVDFIPAEPPTPALCSVTPSPNPTPSSARSTRSGVSSIVMEPQALRGKHEESDTTSQGSPSFFVAIAAQTPEVKRPERLSARERRLGGKQRKVSATASTSDSLEFGGAARDVPSDSVASPPPLQVRSSGGKNAGQIPLTSDNDRTTAESCGVGQCPQFPADPPNLMRPKPREPSPSSQGTSQQTPSQMAIPKIYRRAPPREKKSSKGGPAKEVPPDKPHKKRVLAPMGEGDSDQEAEREQRERPRCAMRGAQRTEMQLAELQHIERSLRQNHKKARTAAASTNSQQPPESEPFPSRPASLQLPPNAKSSELADDELGDAASSHAQSKTVRFSLMKPVIEQGDPVAAEHEGMRHKSRSSEDEIARIADRVKQEMREVVPFLWGAPDSSDDIDFAVPVCAPYSAVQHCTYRVKLIPGHERRGPAAKMIVDRFAQTMKVAMTEAEKDPSIALPRGLQSAVSTIVPDHVSQILVSNVRILSASAERAISAASSRATSRSYVDPMVGLTATSMQ